MKNQLIFIVLITFSLSIKAQIYVPGGTIGTSSNNNVGIGTSNATAKLTIQAGPDGYPTPLKAISIWGPNSPENSNSAQAISWDFAAAGSAALRCYRGGSWDTYMQFLTNSNSAAGNNPQVRMHITGEGNVGIGTTDPLFKLDVKGGGRFLVPDDKSGVGGLTIETINGTNLKIGGNSTYSWIQSHASLPLYINELGNNTIINPVNGNVGIGTSIPDEKLTVKGKIHTQEVKVDMTGPLVPDYVFANDYKLKSLQQVEDYIKENSHLPEIPSAKEIEKNGLMLAEMNMSLLKKIEELTLYAIEQQKNTAKLIQLLDEQNKRLKILEEDKN